MRIFRLALMCLSACMLLQCASKKKAIGPMNSADELTEIWHKIDSLQSKQMDRSALDLVITARALAAKEGNATWMLKAILTQLKLEQHLGDTGNVGISKEIKQELDKASKTVLRACLQSLLAESYAQKAWDQQLHKQNLVSAQLDPEWMSREDLLIAADSLYLLSTSHVLETPLGEYRILLDPAQFDTVAFSTLADVLYWRAIQHHSQQISNGWYNARAYEQEWSHEEPVSNNPERRIQQYFGEWKNTIEESHEEALTAIELRRLALVHQYFKGAHRQGHQAYIDALNQLESQCSEGSSLDRIALQKAEYFLSLSRDQHPNGLIMAYEEVRRVLDRGNQHDRQKAVKMQQAILQKRMTFEMEEILLPDAHFLAKIQFRNLEKMHVKIVTLPSHDGLREDSKEWSVRWKAAYSLPSIHEEEVIMPIHEDFRMHSTDWIGPQLPAGRYALLLHDPDQSLMSFQEFTVSSMALLQLDQPSESSWRVLDRKSGKPLSGIQYKTFVRDYSTRRARLRMVDQGRTDGEGAIISPGQSRGSVIVQLSREEDVLWSDHLYVRSNNQQSRQRKQVRFFTDRAIYRPGQKILFKCMLTQGGGPGKEEAIVAHEELKLTLINVNGEEVSAVSSETDEYGSISAEFELPEKMLLGTVTLRSKYGSHPIRVEAYKRPTFSASIELENALAVLGDTIKIAGQVSAFAGFPIADAQIRYSIVRRVPWHPYYRRSLPHVQEEHVGAGLSQTNGQGRFTFQFETDLSTESFSIYEYEVSADVTDISGETQTFREVFRLGTSPYTVDLSLEDLMIRGSEQAKVELTCLNAMKKKVAVDSFRIRYYMMPGQSWQKDLYWEKPEDSQYQAEEFKSKLPDYTHLLHAEAEPSWLKEEIVNDGTLRLPEDIPAGRIKMHVQAYSGDISGESEVVFELLEPGSSYVPGGDLFHAFPEAELLQVGDELVFWTSSSQPVPIHYEVENANGRRRKGVIDSEGWNALRLPISQEDEGGLVVHFYAVYQNRHQQFKRVIQVPRVDQLLDLEVLQLPQKTSPGARESVRFQVRKADGQTVKAAYSLVVYDAALDDLVPHNWPTVFDQPFTGSFYQRAISFGGLYVHPWKQEHVDGWNIHRLSPNLNWFGIRLRSNRPRLMMRSQAMMDESAEYKQAGQESLDMMENTTVEQENEGEATPRVDFRETLYWIGDGSTSEDGLGAAVFDMSDDLTTWKVMMIVHDPRLRTAYRSFAFESSKDILLQPNLPRFVRMGDHWKFATKVVNTTERGAQTKVSLTFDGQQLASRSLFLQGGQSGTAYWNIDTEGSPGQRAYELQADSDIGRDAVAGQLLVLPRTKLVAATQNLIAEAGEQVIEEFPALRDAPPEIIHEQLVIDLCLDPRLYAIQALPTLQMEHETITSMVEELYSLAVADKVEQLHPGILKQMADAQASSTDLLRNEDLSLVDLDFTPWKRASNDQLRWRKQWTLLGDALQREDRTRLLLLRLTESQSGSGGFPWLEGGRPSRYITQYVLRRLVDISQVMPSTEFAEKFQSLVGSSLTFLDAEVAREWSRNRPDQIMMGHAEYLYIRSTFQEEQGGVKDLIADLRSLAQKSWHNRPIYLQALLVAAFTGWQQEDVTREWLRSLHQRAIRTDNRGVYWKVNPGVNWQEQPLEAHALLMNLFRNTALADADFKDALVRWLTVNRQGNVWAGKAGTVAAIHALLLAAPVTDTASVVMKIGADSLRLEGTDDLFHRLVIPGKDITADQAQIQIINNGTTPVFGFVHWQYFAPIRALDRNASAVSVDKEVFKVVLEDGQEHYLPVADQALEVGDRVLTRFRLTIDRPLDFMHLQDSRSSVLEPIERLSKHEMRNGLYLYRTHGDTDSHFFIDHLSRGNHIVEYEAWITHEGDVGRGIAELQSALVPGHYAHSLGGSWQVGVWE
ncbi:MAG: hypothetical protein KTR24_04320 [Saprospiraceae bacterium]|nr:hypothetical protein [Saprospiraceae bacterium]